MKKHLFNIFAVALLLIATIATCKKEEADASGIKLDQPEVELLVGETAILKATLIPKNANKTVIWESSKPDVATVEKGKITAVAFGITTITATTHNGHTAKCAVVVIQAFEPEMIRVQGGTFTMGCTDDECMERELPTHQVTLSSFSIGKYPVTQKEFEALMGYNPSYYKNCEDCPVGYVGWNEMQSYIQKLNTITGKNYRLPTEAEWEYAARGGNKSEHYKYSGSNNVHEVAWIDSKSHPVGTKKPNELEIYDMCGNVFETCSDWYELYTDEHQENPQGPPTGTLGRVIRGGNYGNYPFYSRIAYRMPDISDASMNGGFRLAHP